MTKNETIEPKDGLRLRKIGSRYMIVEACNGNVNMTDVFSLNETAARLWQRINEGKLTPEELAGWLCDEYDTDRDTALTDVQRQLEEWKAFGLIR
ncbi:PqqD family protein [Phocaeicola dorei]|jgi:hypothetical protein|uniref:PqqD family protein n=2 Tax=Phocaeicola dorei TaxID=357276 RepID=I8W0T8_9BACT|nr:PqqD family protein [Phocaeicola dorei]EIY26936.1 hypothetical protein HMPREF1063_01906 [Phocaeicola dorei CL02T00C15]EIY32265.1 hypothetical protein HMPREF1064_02808 [Phocaeicola dorei CL02T12C06]